MSALTDASFALTGDRLELLPLDDRSWRLCDRLMPHQDAAYVIAYIERTPGGLAVVWLRGGDAPTRFRRLEDVADQALRVMRAPESRGATRPVPIPHFAPVPHRAG